MITSRFSRGARLASIYFSLVLLSTVLSGELPAQNSGGGGSAAALTISAAVRDDSSGAPLARAQLRLSWSGPLATAGSGAPLEFLSANGRSGETNSAGRFEFTGLIAGEYRLIGWAAGFRADTVYIQLGNPGFDYTFRLTSEATRLPPVDVVRTPTQPFRIPDSRLADSIGVRALLFKLMRGGYLAQDVRDITSRDISDAVTLAEPDIFRTLQRTAGVGTRDDYTATLWTRGAPWDQTRVYFDGQPLYNPTHGGWLFSSINPEGIGAAYYMPGARPAWIGDGAAGVLDLESRRGGSDGDFQASADVSVVSARASFDGVLPSMFGAGARQGNWTISMRRTYVDWFTSAMSTLGSTQDRIPYNFSDAIARIETALPLGARLEGSGLYERDHLRGDFPGILRRNEASWGNRAGRLTVAAPVGGAELRLTAGATRFGTQLLELDGEAGVDPDEDPTLPSLENALTHQSATLEIVSRERIGARPRWTAGIQFSRQKAEYDGPFSLTAEGIPGVDPDQVIRIPFNYQASLDTRAYWGQYLFDLSRALRLDLGVRAENGGDLANVGRWRISPRLQGRLSLDGLTDISVGWSESVQYAQDVGAAAGPLGPQLHLTHIWQLASRGVPALSSRITTVGVERQLGRGWLLGVSGYRRESSGLTIPDPVPGEIRADRPLFKVATNNATGVEFSLERMSGGWTGAASYALARSELESEGFTFASPADVRHTLDLSVSRRLGDHLRLSSVFSYASGVPYTRFVISNQGLRLEEPYARRTPAHASADVSLDYSRVFGISGFSAYLQVRNVFNRGNRVTYSGSEETCLGTIGGDGMCSGSLQLTDRFDDGIPVLPLVGLRVVF